MKYGALKSLRARLLLLVFISIIPVLIFLFYTAAEQKRHQESEIKADTFHLVKLTSKSIEELTDGARQTLSVLSKLQAVREHDSTACNAYFSDIREGLLGYDNIIAANPNGDIFCSAVPFRGHISAADRQWFQRPIQSGKFSFGSYHISRISGRSVINAGLPVFDTDGNLKAVVAVSINLSRLTEVLSGLWMSSSAAVLAIDREGTVLSRNLDSETWIGKKMPDSEIVKTILTQKEGSIESVGPDGIKRMYVFVPVNGTDDGIFICLGIATEAAFAEVNKKLLKELAWLGILAFIASLAAWYGGDLLVLRRMNGLIKATIDLSKGNLGVRVKISGKKDEISQLEQSFNDMASTIESDLLQRMKAEELLIRAKKEWERTFDCVPDLIAIIDNNYRIQRVNNSMAQRLGRSAAECVGLVCYEVVHGLSSPLENCPVACTFKDGMPHNEEIYERFLGGDFLISSNPLHNESGRMIGTVHVAHDITERKRDEAELKKVNRALKTVSKCNEALVHAGDEATFLRKICEILIEDGGYRMAWIGYAEQQGDRRVLPVVHAGHEDGYLSTANITWQDVERGRGPTGTAMRTRSVCVQNNIQTHPDFAPWRENALKRGYSSTIALPLIADDQCFGVLTIYAPEQDVFIEQEIRLLKELVDDVAFGILMLRIREERNKSQEELRGSYEQLHSLAAHMQSVREEQRAEIAREVHDELGQILTVLKFDLFSVAAKLKDINEPLHETVKADVDLIDSTIQTVKKICTELRPGILDHLGLSPAIEWQVHEFQERSGIESEIILPSEEVTNDKDLGIALFRILQEALTNILRHSKATRVRVALNGNEDNIVLEIYDNGIGITGEDLSKTNSFGLVGIRERVYPWKGDVQITGSSDKGTSLKIIIPRKRS